MPVAPATVRTFRWLGADEPCLDAPAVAECGPVAVGRYGGGTLAGARKNEDGALVWVAPGAWECATVLDAHNSAESAALVLDALAAEAGAIAAILDGPLASAFGALERHIVGLFSSAAFRARCQAVRGETACLIVARKGRFLWWFAVGDCVAYLFHPDLARLGQYALNIRSFFEWIGQVHSFDLPSPCYARGVRELRRGRNVVALTTDGLLECHGRPFEDSAHLAALFTGGAAEGVGAALTRVHQAPGRDSATLIAWSCDNPEEGARPTA